jgi:hypothetical protein
MPRTNNKPKDNNTKTKSKAAEPQKRRSRPQDDSDDDSVDSRGNIRGLIAYSSEEESEYTPETSETSYRDSSSSSDARHHSKHKSKNGKSKSNAKKGKSRDESESEEERPKRKAAKKAEKRIKKRLEEDDAKAKAKAKAKKQKERRRKESSTTEETEDEDDYDEDDYVEDEEDDDLFDEEDDEIEVDEDDDYDEEDEEENEGNSRGGPNHGGIELFISDFSEAMRPQKPKKYKLKNEPENVRRFVKLVQTETEPNEADIDRDIGYFKALTPKAQDRVLAKLQHKVEPVEQTVPLKFQIMMKEVAPEVERVAMAKYHALQSIDPSTTEYYKIQQWIHGYTELPLGVYRDLPVKMDANNDKENAECRAFVSSVREHMDSAIYGHDDAKLQILQFVSNWIANPKAAGNVLSIHGPPGVGKTTLIKDGVAKALGRPFHFITLGGATDASYLDGHSYTYEGSTWGRIVDVLIKSKCMNPVIYFDELDKVSETPKGEEINNLLIHLTDGSQNDRFQDKYFAGIDLDLSRCLFIFSHNDHSRVNPILKDRMYNIQVDGFNLKEKLVIAEQYLVGDALREANLFEKIGINRDLLTHIVETYTGDEKGVRELKRCIQTIVSKVNLLRFYNDPAKVPFAIQGFNLPFTLKKEHIDLFLKKKELKDMSALHMYS